MNRQEEILHQKISETWHNLHKPTTSPEFQRLICNWTNSESGKSGNKARTMGVKKGIADWMYLREDGRTAWIELKTEDGKQSPEQVQFEKLCISLNHEYHICRSIEHFFCVIGKK